ncbi:MAG: translation initiation factor IF-2 [Bacteroidales bacterium]|nr:translation initiation factor IF-2 [Bacteroidales bacterium]
MSGNPIRLRKAAQEFNVGTSTIIEFLKKKGNLLEDNPNTKIPEDLYGLLVAEFKKDRETKLGAEKIHISTAREQKTITIDDKPKKIVIDDEVKWKTSTPTLSDNLIIRATTLSKTPIIPLKSEETTAKKAEAEKKTPPPVEKVEKPVVVEPVKRDKVEEPKPAPEPEPTPAPKEEPTPKPKPTTPKPELPTPVEKPVAAPVQPVPVEETTLPVEKKPEVVAVEVPKTTEPEKVDTKIPKIEVKVVDHIDIASIQPAKKSSSERKKERRRKEREAKAAAAAAQQKEAPAPQTGKQEKPATKAAPTAAQERKVERSDDNVIRVRAPQIQGPKILTTIDLSQFDKPKPVASSSEDHSKKRNKKKRARIETAKPGKPAGQQQQQPPQQQQQQQQQRPEQQRGKRPDQPRTDFPRKDQKSFGKKRAPKLEIKVAPTEEEIKKQISDTLNKLTNPSKSKASKHRKEKREGIREKMAFEAQRAEEEKNILKVTEFLTANELASMMNITVTEVIKKCMDIGLFVSINQRLDAETIVFIADEFGYQVTFIDAEDQDAKQEEDVDAPEDLLPRHPVVTVMGHVDHGKTKLLDYIRHANVVAGEAGGITQHIGAYSVTLDDGRKITFLDTPGHEAFTAMRARGAKVTDVAIIVIAADDDVMPQTKEAINHAQAANVPIVIAINKIDKPTADADKIRKQLAELNILVEEWGGKYQCQEISAKQGINVDLLLEKVLLEAEMLELKANPDRFAKGSVIESKLEPGRGYVASVLVQSGTLQKGNVVLAGQYYGRVKALFNERYQLIDSVPPATPALILGINGAPQAGDNFIVMKEEREARILATKRQQLQREIGLRTQKHITLDDIGRNIARGSFKELNIIVKGDVDGSVEALSDSLLKLSTDEVQVNVIHKSVGAIIESDVLLASASNAIIVGFQVRPSVSARKLAEAEEIDIRLYSIIYNAIEEIKSAIEGMLAPEIKEEITCNVEVREIFKIQKTGTVAGCLVLDGIITRDAKVRIIRDGIVVYTGLLGSLKRYKDDAKDVRSGMECGLNIHNFNDIKVGDIIEGYKETEIKRILN